MITVLRGAMFFLLGVSFILFFYQIRKSKIVERKVKEIRTILSETTQQRAREAKKNIALSQNNVKGSFPERIIERVESRFIYSRIGRLFRGLTVELWIILVLVSTAAVYFLTQAMSGSLVLGMTASGMYFAVIMLAEMLLALRNYKTVDENLLKFLNILGNYSLTNQEITGVFHQISRYMPPVLEDVLDECFYDAQTSGDASVALHAMSNKIEHPQFKEIIRNIETCSHYTADYKVVVDSMRKIIMDEQRAKRERKAIANEAVIEIFIVTIMLLICLAVANEMVAESIWSMLVSTTAGHCCLVVMAAFYIFFFWQIATAER